MARKSDFTHAEEVKGGKHSHMHHKKMHDHHMSEAKKHASHLHKMAKSPHKESAHTKKMHEAAAGRKYNKSRKHHLAEARAGRMA